MKGLNLAIGPSCFVRCRGCYNHFGNSLREDTLIKSAEILEFVEAAQAEGLRKVTLSGGDPLTHPEIGTILRGLGRLGVEVRIDTVGTALLSDAPTIFYGRREIKQISTDHLRPMVRLLSLPLDGATKAELQQFRVGRSDLMAETLRIAEMVVEAGIPLGINTVVHQGNVGSLAPMYELVQGAGATLWQLFEFQPTGPIGSRQQESLGLPAHAFTDAITELMCIASPGAPRIEPKDKNVRRDLYLLVDDAGMAWSPTFGPVRTTYGHITRDREAVLDALRTHLRP